MKKIILVFTFILVSNSSFAQGMPVYDNINFVSFIKQLLEAGKQTSEMIKQVKFLKEAKEAYDKVSGSIKDFRTVERVLSKNKQIYSLMNQDLRKIISSKYVTAEEASRILDVFESFYEKSIEDLGFIEQLLQDNFLKMQDADRYKMLSEMEANAIQTHSRLLRKTKRLAKIVELREFADHVNNRSKGI